MPFCANGHYISGETCRECGAPAVDEEALRRALAQTGQTKSAPQEPSAQAAAAEPAPVPASPQFDRAPTAPRVKRRLLPHWRKMTWVIMVFNLVMLIWLIAGVGSAASSACKGLTGDALTSCQAGTAVGAGIGAAVIIGLWIAGDVILGILWLVTNRKKTRECPACGSDVRKGLTECPSCQHDFRAAAAKA